jgi:phenylacetate-CoA ligase
VIAKLIYRAGVVFRNPLIPQRLTALLETQQWNRDRLHDQQLKKLRSLVRHAYASCSHYRAKFDRIGVSPETIVSLECLKRLPSITKEELIANREGIQTAADSERLFYSETSGSTGKPLVFYRNQDWDAWHRASVFRGYSWYGVKPWERNGYMWGYNFSLKRAIKTRMLDAVQNRFRLFSYKNEEIDRFISKLGSATYLSGYSSMIYEVAKRINASNRAGSFPRLKMIKGTSEKIFDKYRDEIKAAFGIPIISEYGAAEAGIIAFECPSGSMHVNMETAIIEEENNEILVTNLVSRSFPIIRYKLGDYIRIDRESLCACGMQHEIVREVLGRVGKVIYGMTNQYPSLTLYYVFKNLAMEHGIIMNYQAAQSQKGQLTLRIEGHLSQQHRQALMKEIVKYFSADLTVHIKDGEELHTRKGKKTDFISELDR